MEKTVNVVEYDENWVNLFNIEKEILSNVFSEILIRIEHFGSTSIHGMAAKPIIDIFVFVDNIL